MKLQKCQKIKESIVLKVRMPFLRATWNPQAMTGKSDMDDHIKNGKHLYNRREQMKKEMTNSKCFQNIK